MLRRTKPLPRAPANAAWRLWHLRGIACVLTAVVLWTGLALPASAEGGGDFVVIVNEQNQTTSVSRDFLADAFLKKASRWDGGEIIHPVDRRADASVRKSFSNDVIKRTVAAVRSYWQQRIFSGGALPPPEFDSDEDVVRYVAKYSGGVGYVSPSAKLVGTRAIVVR